MLAALDGNQAPGDEIDLRPSVFGRRVEPVEAHLFGLVHQLRQFFGRYLVGIWIESVFKGDDFLAHESSHHINDDPLLVT